MPRVHLPDRDETVEVGADDIEVGDDEDLVLKTQEDFNSTIQSRLNRERQKVREELASDEEWLRDQYADTFGVELREDGRPKGSTTDDELQQLKKKASKADSLQSEVEELREAREEYRREQAWNEFRKHAPDPADGAEEDAKAAFFRQVDYDDEYGFVAVDDDGDIRYDAGEPVGIGGVADELTSKKGFLFQSTEMDSGPAGDPDGTQTTGTTMSRSQYEQKRDRAIDKGDDETLAELEEAMAEGRVTDT